VLLERVSEIRPRHVAMENVAGFQQSRAADRLRHTLRRSGYRFLERLFCPTQWGIPNRRPRCYLVASLDGTPKLAPIRERAWSISDFFETDAAAFVFLPTDVVDRYRNAIHVIDRASRGGVANCFTSAYGRSLVRSGSYLLEAGRVRYFTPREILRCLGFPDTFSLGNNLAVEKSWKLVGNSLSVPVVRYMLASILG
jgi:site-specific DNA-cytosine methylase